MKKKLNKYIIDNEEIIFSFHFFFFFDMNIIFTIYSFFNNEKTINPYLF